MPVLYIDKPKGITSFKLCEKLRPVLGTRRIGHTGTLDPNATGVMIVLYDNSTKANQFIVSDTKEYIGKCKLGIETDTLDIDGTIIRSERLKMPSKEEILDVFDSFIGSYNQIPPMTSAIKINGKKLYEYQRNNEEVEVKPRRVDILSLELLSIDEEGFEFKCEVSSGTYIRSLLKDILEKLGVFGTLLELTRTRINDIGLEECDKLEEVLKGNYHTHNLYDVLSKRYKVYKTNKPDDIKNGKPLNIEFDCNEMLIVDDDKNCLAIYRKENNVFRSVRGLF